MQDQQWLEKMHSGRGFIAALDQSGGSTPKALKLYGIDESAYANGDEMFALIHAMRTRIMTAPAFNSDNILGAILFESTLDRQVGGLPTTDYLWGKGILPFLKIDAGLDAEAGRAQLMKPIPGLDALLEKAVENKVFGTKMRSVIHGAEPDSVKAVVAQQFALAKKIIGYGLIPIIEPEVDIYAPDKAEAEVMLLEALYRELLELHPEDKVIFKLSLPSA
ncbi:MAG: fructose-bisphosphate aldolase, partial [Firmicutes bacterium]|nr:fructose-bisphosphate aldolase [Bacillota bacterium]